MPAIRLTKPTQRKAKTMLVEYVCPTDNDVVLYTEDPNAVHVAQIGDEPKQCEKCKKSFYKWECTKRRR